MIMKTILLILILFQSQKANTVIIAQSDTYNLLVESLHDNGFTIEEYDPEFGIFETKPRETKYGAEMMIKGRIYPDKIELQYFTRLDITVNGVRSNSWDLQYIKSGSGYKRTAYDLFINVISVFIGERTYLKK